jgi:hypothetical protein
MTVPPPGVQAGFLDNADFDAGPKLSLCQLQAPCQPAGAGTCVYCVYDMVWRPDTVVYAGLEFRNPGGHWSHYDPGYHVTVSPGGISPDVIDCRRDDTGGTGLGADCTGDAWGWCGITYCREMVGQPQADDICPDKKCRWWGLN